MAEATISVLSHFWAPLCAVGSHGSHGPNAQICVSVFGASIVPERPRLLVVLSNTNYTTGLVRETGSMTVSVLGESQVDLLEPLGLRSGRGGNKLAGLDYQLTTFGDPFFLAGAAGWLAGEVLESSTLGDSTAFLVAVREHHDGSASPLTWRGARTVVGEEFLAAWAGKSAREQAAARERMTWR